MLEILRQRSVLRSPRGPCIKLWVVNVALATGTRLSLSLSPKFLDEGADNGMETCGYVLRS